MQWDYGRGCSPACLFTSTAHIHSPPLFSFVHPYPPFILCSFSVAFIQIVACVFSLSLPFFLAHTLLVFFSFPSLAIFLSVAASVFCGERERQWESRQRVKSSSSRIGNWKEKERNRGREREKCCCRSSAFWISHCCCWLDVIQWDSIDKNRSWLVGGNSPASISISTSLFPWGINCFSRHIFSLVTSLYVNFFPWNKLDALKQVSSLSLLPLLPVHSEGVKVKSGKVLKAWNGMFVSKNKRKIGSNCLAMSKQMRIHLDTGCICFLYHYFGLPKSAFLEQYFRYISCRVVETAVSLVGPEGNISIWWIAMKFDPDIHNPQIMNLMTFQATCSAFNRSVFSLMQWNI